MYDILLTQMDHRVDDVGEERMKFKKGASGGIRIFGSRSE